MGPSIGNGFCGGESKSFRDWETVKRKGLDTSSLLRFDLNESFAQEQPSKGPVCAGQ